ncbi:hypothetical protein K0M31_011654 [Melipona bicolor]|uniref:Uncharacterized protein n=1 Tax=Melipona bicolor TaxID=60889 RepID=A0AA40KUZ5_9HYME|nr:hypothetical protein K0M31_011654 [Melipona bicolor]
MIYRKQRYYEITMLFRFSSLKGQKTCPDIDRNSSKISTVGDGSLVTGESRGIRLLDAPPIDSRPRKCGGSEENAVGF